MLCAALILSACSNGPGLSGLLGQQVPVAVAPQLTDPPAWMVSGCPELAPLPKHAFNQKDTEAAWARDAASYHNCRMRYYALRNYYRKRDSGLRAKPVTSD